MNVSTLPFNRFETLGAMGPVEMLALPADSLRNGNPANDPFRKFRIS